jgi:hypothetical protein
VQRRIRLVGMEEHRTEDRHHLAKLPGGRLAVMSFDKIAVLILASGKVRSLRAPLCRED